MKGFKKYVLLPLVLTLLGVGYYLVTRNNIYGNNEQSIKWIASHFTRSGILQDYQNELGIDSDANIKLYVTDEFIKIGFGKVNLTWKPEEFTTLKNQELLKTIFITMDNDPKTGKLRVYYKGNELQRWVN